jgi:hypothetical protein
MLVSGTYFIGVRYGVTDSGIGIAMEGFGKTYPLLFSCKPSLV